MDGSEGFPLRSLGVSPAAPGIQCVRQMNHQLVVTEVRNGGSAMRSRIEVYAKSWCPYSTRALSDLMVHGIVCTAIDVTWDDRRESEMVDRCGSRSVPQVFIDGAHIGGCIELLAAGERGDLESLLAA